MSKKLWCVRQGGKLAGDYFEKKTDAKAQRDSFEGELPEHPEISTAWKYHVSRGPDHWRSHAK